MILCCNLMLRKFTKIAGYLCSFLDCDERYLKMYNLTPDHRSTIQLCW